jgi:hypothetical protein
MIDVMGCLLRIAAQQQPTLSSNPGSSTLGIFTVANALKKGLLTGTTAMLRTKERFGRLFAAPRAEIVVAPKRPNTLLDPCVAVFDEKVPFARSRRDWVNNGIG